MLSQDDFHQLQIGFEQNNCKHRRTRSAFFTGYDPYHVGTQHGTFDGAEPTGVPLNFTFFTKQLQSLNYTNYMVGKWHLGYCKKEYLPTSRGFDYFQGFLQYGGDYFQHQSYSDVPDVDGGPLQTVFGYDFWKQDQINFNEKGEYSTELFAQTASQYLAEHKQEKLNKPFFMYLAFQATHKPLQVPQKYLKFCHQSDRDRQMYCGQLSEGTR